MLKTGPVIWLTGGDAARRQEIAHDLRAELLARDLSMQLIDDEFLGLFYANPDGPVQDRAARVARVFSGRAEISVVSLEIDLQAEHVSEIERSGFFLVRLAPATGGDNENAGDGNPTCFYPDTRTTEPAGGQVVKHLLDLGVLDDRKELKDEIYRSNSYEKALSRFPLASFLLFVSRAKRSLRSAFSGLFEDLLQVLRIRRYEYPHRILFVAGMPKSGTTWLQTMLGLIPGYQIRPIYDPSRAPQFRDVTPMTFDLLPKYGYSVVKLHTRYSAYNLSTILAKAGRCVVLHRDLRDICVSRYFHVLNQPSHRHHELYKRIGKDAAIFHCINILRGSFFTWANDWQRAARENPGAVLEVRYEEMHRDVIGTMKKVLQFYGVPADGALIQLLSDSQIGKARGDLKKGLSKGDTSRKGAVGDWSEHFSQENKIYFKRIAGELLVELGYSDGSDW